MSVDAAKLAALVANLTGGAVADPEALQAVIEDYGTKINGKANKAQETWNVPTLLNGWVNYGSGQALVAYYKDETGCVHIKGLVKEGTAVSNTTLFVLPAGYRPSEIVLYSTASNGGYGQAYVRLNGDVVFDVGSNVFFSLNGLSFRAEA